MFAKSSTSQDYHLLRTDNDQTLCGLVVIPLIIDRPVKSTHLHLTTARPKTGGLCQKCAEVDKAPVELAEMARASGP